MGVSADDQPALIVADQPVQCVSSFVCLGCAISPDSRIAGEVDRRLANAAKAFGSLQCVLSGPKTLTTGQEDAVRWLCHASPSVWL